MGAAVLESACLTWSGARSKGGYGQKRVEGRVLYVHRLAWEEAYGPIPDGLFVLHRCDNPPCYEPTHLFLGTNADNMADRDAKRRQWNAAKTHCKHGHEFTPENTAIIGPRKQRRCRECHRNYNRKRQNNG